MEALGCFLDPGGCFNSGIAGIIAWFPFGIEGIKAAVWMIVGACLGKWGVGAVLTLAVALKVTGKPVSTEQQYGMPEPVKPKKKRPTIFNK